MLYGADDRDNFLPTLAAKAAFFTNSYERIVLPGIGHFLHREAPDVVAETALRLR